MLTFDCPTGADGANNNVPGKTILVIGDIHHSDKLFLALQEAFMQSEYFNEDKTINYTFAKKMKHILNAASKEQNGGPSDGVNESFEFIISLVENRLEALPRWEENLAAMSPDYLFGHRFIPILWTPDMEGREKTGAHGAVIPVEKIASLSKKYNVTFLHVYEQVPGSLRSAAVKINAMFHNLL